MIRQEWNRPCLHEEQEPTGSGATLLTDLPTRPPGMRETTRDTGDAYRGLRQVSGTYRNVGDVGDARRSAHNPATASSPLGLRACPWQIRGQAATCSGSRSRIYAGRCCYRCSLASWTHNPPLTRPRDRAIAIDTRAARNKSATQCPSAESAFGATSQGGGARRPFTHCVTATVYHVAVSVLVTELRALEVSYPTRRPTP